MYGVLFVLYLVFSHFHFQYYMIIHDIQSCTVIPLEQTELKPANA